MKNYIFKAIVGLLMNVLPFYCQAEEKTSKSLVKLRNDEEKARINAIENPNPENIAKYKEIMKACMHAAEKFAEEYAKGQKRSDN